MKRARVGWNEKALAAMIELEYGKGLPERARRPGPYPVYGSSGIVGFHDEALVAGPGIIVGRKGSIGTVHYESRDFYPIDTVFYVRPKDREVDLRFLYYMLDASHLNMLNTDAAVPGLNRQVALRQRFLVPPLPTQRKIAAILSAYDDLIENNLRRIKILEEMAQLIYREWFVHFRFPGHEDVPMADSPLGPIPEGWESTRLGQMAQEVRRSVQPDEVDPQTPYVGLEHLPRKSLALSSWSTASEAGSTKLLFKRGEILFGKIRPYLHKVAIAPVEGICSADTIVMAAVAPRWFPTLLMSVFTERFVDYATQTSQGTKMPRANWSTLAEYEIPMPPPAVLSPFNHCVQNIVDQLINMAHLNRTLALARDLLLPHLVSGRIDVSDLGIETGELPQ